MVEEGSADIEGHAIVLGGERFEVGADLVGDIAGGGLRSVPTMQRSTCLLHQMAAGIVDDDGVRHALLPSSKAVSEAP